MADRTFGVTPGALRSAAASILVEQAAFQQATRRFTDGVGHLRPENGWVAAYNDAILSAMEAGDEAIDAFRALVANLGERANGLLTNDGNYEETDTGSAQGYLGDGREF